MKAHTLFRTSFVVFAAAAALGAFAADPADSTPPPPPPPHHGKGEPGAQFDPERRLARLTERLGLTAEQQAQLRPIFAAQADEMKKLEAASLTGEQRREKMRELHKADREKIAAILTPEQRAKFAEDRPPRHGEGRRGERKGEAEAPKPAEATK